MTLEAETLNPGRGRRGRRGENTSATSPTVVDTALPNPSVDAALDAIGMTPDDLVPADEHVVDPPAQPQPQPQPQQPVGLEAFDEVPLVSANEDVMNPFRRTQMLPPRETKTQQRDARIDNRQALNQPTPSTKRLGAMGRKLPGAEHIKIHKRVDNGRLAYIGEYHPADLVQSQNVESFTAKYIQPKYGPGEYQITGVNAAGQEFDAGHILLLAPLSDVADPVAAVSSGTTPLNLVQQMLDRDAARRDAEIRALTGAQKDPIKMLREMHDLQQVMTPAMPTLTPSDNSRGNSNDTLMAGVMNLMGTVLAMAMRPKETDPLLLALINNLATNNKPQPPLDATAQLVQLSEVVKNLQGNNGGSGSSNQMLEMLMRERMSPADVLGLVNQVKGERGTDDLKKSVENLGFLLNTVQQLRSHTEPSGGSGFWDAVNSIFANPGLASAIGSKVRSIGDGAARPVQALPAHTQTPAQAPPRDPLALKARELTARKMRIEEMQIVEAERRLGLAAPPPASPQLPPIPTATAAVAVAVEEPGEPGPLATPNGEGVTLPPRITDHLNSYMTARDDGDIVATTIELIFSLKEDEKWQPYSEVIVGCILKNDRASFMQYMSSLLVSLRHIGMLDDALAHKISDTLQKHFSVIVEETTKRMVAEGSPADSTEEDGEGDGDPEGDDDDGGEEDPDDLLQIS